MTRPTGGPTTQGPRLYVGSTAPTDARSGDLWIAQAWADTLLSAMGVVSAAQRARDEERKWLVESLKADLAPDWLIELVLERWK